MADAKAWEDQLISEMRAHDGKVTSGPLAGHPLLIMTSTGAKSGEPRRAVLTYHLDGSDYVVAGSAGGSKSDPSWIHNLERDPSVTIEVDNRQVPAIANIVDDAERDRLWEEHVKALPWFADYPQQSGRVIPMVRLKPASTR
jgi:deazaflavin-dependent oxidoreductase (nitroreductase family)